MADLVTRFARAPRAGVIAPAGCGKTELIAAAIESGKEGRALVLTHTHAGIHALRRRLRRRGVDARCYHVDTIAAWALRYAMAFPERSGFRVEDPRHIEIWSYVYEGARQALEVRAIRDVVRRSYTCAYVDEYQDCVAEQHRLIRTLAGVIPCRIVGDPLQGIFGFGGQRLVDWPTEVEETFEIIGELSRPWRWLGIHPELGQWTIALRGALLSGQPLDLRGSPVRWEPKTRERQVRACRELLRMRKSSIVALDSHAGQCHRWAQQMPGFGSDEEMESRDLFSWAKRFDHLTGPALAAATIEFGKKCMSGLASELKSAHKSLQSSRLPQLTAGTKHKTTVQALRTLGQAQSPEGVSEVLEEFDRLSGCRVYRPEVWREMRLAARVIAKGGSRRFEDAIWQIRGRTRRTGKKLPRAVVSRTLLVKGMEFDHALVLDADSLDAKNLYVAATRGSRSLTIFSDKPVLFAG